MIKTTSNSGQKASLAKIEQEMTSILKMTLNSGLQASLGMRVIEGVQATTG